MNFIVKNSYICGQYIREYIVCRFFVWCEWRLKGVQK